MKLKEAMSSEEWSDFKLCHGLLAVASICLVAAFARVNNPDTTMYLLMFVALILGVVSMRVAKKWYKSHQ